MITKLIGIFVLVGTLAGVYLFETSSGQTGAFRILHWPAIILTGVGPAGLLLLCSNWRRISATFRILTRKSAERILRHQERETAVLHQISQRFYVHGPRVLDEVDRSNLSPALQRTFRRLSMRIPVCDVRDLLERERDQVETRLQQSVSLLSLGVRLAPSIGMLGTILGMVQLLAGLKDLSNIGSHMSLALLTTFYGLFFSLVLWTPLVQKVQAILDAETDAFDKVLHWLELLEERKPAQYFEEGQLEAKPVPATVKPNEVVRA